MNCSVKNPFETTMAKLGPCPEITVAVFSDLGLDDAEIASYFGIPLDTIARFRQPQSKPLQGQV